MKGWVLMKKARLYARVSTAEQKRKNISIPVQIAALNDFCSNNQYTVVGTYIDNGVSASSLTKRKQFLKMIEESEQGDYILFTRLDRFSRNVLDANKIVKELNKKKIYIISIFEDDINTSTADGMFMFNLRVSLSQREIEKDSERILDVFESKLKKGEVLTGQMPLGYVVRSKKPCINEFDAEIVRFIFDTYIQCGNLNETVREVIAKYSKPMCPSTVQQIIANEKYIGKYRGINNYFPPIIDVDTFYEANKVYKERYVKSNKKNVTYLFSGLLRCEVCGHRMSSYYRVRKNINYYYTCQKKVMGGTIQHFCKSEKKIEKELLKNIKTVIKNNIVSVSEKDLSENHEEEIKKLKQKLERAKELYIDGYISREEFDDKSYDINSRLVQIDANGSAAVIRRNEKLNVLLESDISSIYEKFDRKQKAIFWRNLIDHIVVHKDNSLDIYLL